MHFGVLNIMDMDHIIPGNMSEKESSVSPRSLSPAPSDNDRTIEYHESSLDNNAGDLKTEPIYFSLFFFTCPIQRQ